MLRVARIERPVAMLVLRTSEPVAGLELHACYLRGLTLEGDTSQRLAYRMLVGGCNDVSRDQS